MKNLKFENAKIYEKDGHPVVAEKIEDNVVERDLIGELRPYYNIDGLNLKLTKARKAGAGRKSATKYVCPKCGKKVSSSADDLVIRCVNCNEEFKKPEK